MTAPELNPYAPSKVAADPGPPASKRALAERRATRGQRIAGALLIGNAVLVIAESAITSLRGYSAVPLSPSDRTIVGLIWIGIGASLLAGSRKLLVLAYLGAVLGLMGSVGLYVLKGDMAGAVLQIMFSGATLALLVGDPGKHRTRAALSAAGLYGIVQVFSVGSLLTGTNPIAPFVWFLSGDTELSAVYEVQGIAYRYTLAMPNDAWRLRTAKAATKDDPSVDRWVVRPDKEAHVATYVEELQEDADIDAYANEILHNARNGWKNVTLMGRETLGGHAGQARLLHLWATVDGMEMEYLHGVFFADGHVFQVVAWAERWRFPALEQELRGIIHSFRLGR